jgi:DNA-binding transcriptional regulator LsrR (DeoR family)
MSAYSGVVKAHVAQLHYVRGMSKQDIALRLGMSRFKVARLIDEAVADGTVRFHIQQPVDVDDALSRALETRFGLDLAVVARDGGDETAPARAAAAWLPELVREVETIGVAWGATLQRVADALVTPPAPLGIRVVQICGAVAGLEPGTGPAETTQRFADRLGGRPYPLHAPALSSALARDELARNPAIAPIVAMFDEVGLAVVGIGQGRDLPGAPAAAAGHLLVHVYDEGGVAIGSDTAQMSIAMSAEQLRRTRVVAVASGEAKKRAVAGALRTGLINSLFTDPACASYALGWQ